MEDNSSLLLPILKVIVMIAFFFIVIFVGTLPIRSKQFKKRPLLRAIGSTFTGCLFLNVSLLHILPEAAETLDQILKDGDPDKEVFPLANLLLMVGFTITVFFTKVLAFHSHKDDHDEELYIDHKDQKSDLTNKEEQKNFEKLEQGTGNKNQLKRPLFDGEQQVEHTGAYHKHHHLQNKSMLNEAYLLTLAMYFHTIFQGIAIGVQDTTAGFLSTAVAIAFHKWADALSMGCHYKSKNIATKTSYLLIIGQAILNVVAIGLGWIISNSGEVAQAIFLSISAGTFLAISTLQMLGEQLHHKQFMVVKFLVLIGATAFVSAIWFVENSIFS